MQELDRAIARLRLLLAELAAKSGALALTQAQYHDQLDRLTEIVLGGDIPLDRTLGMMMDLDARLEEIRGQERYVDRMRTRAQRELDQLNITRLVDETQARIATVRGRLAVAEGEELAALREEMHRLEETIEVAIRAAATSVSDR